MGSGFPLFCMTASGAVVGAEIGCAATSWAARTLDMPNGPAVGLKFQGAMGGAAGGSIGGALSAKIIRGRRKHIDDDDEEL